MIAVMGPESPAAARAAGREPWMRDNLEREPGVGLVRRPETGSRAHAVRRVAEPAGKGAVDD
ncbi:hypothetical protein [Actinomadura macrotermitis]|uniref:Uncharacterized protein n=1 Tax=Actinomadura macrotermitis TaxID=2585200 RepID=A0A7K0C8A4_9ACTN|nr:hypothetical protein [Actinomadura macrotermitis]MQY09680.1 hypothetical protein [Actinomadura macrotermitis]